MFARVSRYRGDADALRSGFSSVTDELEQLEGFAKAYFLVDAERGTGMSITLWQSADALEASAQRAHEMRSRATQDATASTESVESFELVLTAAPAARAG
jgi:heme-degrading monooxygenase HmoA